MGGKRLGGRPRLSVSRRESVAGGVEGRLRERNRELQAKVSEKDALIAQLQGTVQYTWGSTLSLV